MKDNRQIPNLLHKYGTYEKFNMNLMGGLIHKDSICFIEDTRQVYAQGCLYGISKEEFDRLKEEINFSFDEVIKRIKNIEDSKGKPDGIATLNSSGVVPSSQLPSYVDDVLSYPTFNNFPLYGEEGKIYITEDTNITYRWAGESIGYVEISKSIGLGENESTAFPGNRGKKVEDGLEEHINDFNNPHNVSKEQIGLENVDNTSDLEKPISIAVQRELERLKNEMNYPDFDESNIGDFLGISEDLSIEWRKNNSWLDKYFSEYNGFELLNIDKLFRINFHNGSLIQGPSKNEIDILATGDDSIIQLSANTTWISNDLDSIRIGHQYTKSKTISESIRSYFTKNRTEEDSFMSAEDKIKLDKISVDNFVSDESFSSLEKKVNSIIEQKGVAEGYATLDVYGQIPVAQLPIIPSSKLPSYVDDVLEYTSKSLFPSLGETGKIYVDTTSNLTYRWSGTSYVEISPSIALGTTSSTAFPGDRGLAIENELSLLDNSIVHLTGDETISGKKTFSDITVSSGKNIAFSGLTSNTPTNALILDNSSTTHVRIGKNGNKSFIGFATTNTSESQSLRISGVATPTQTNDAANKSYVDNSISSIDKYSLPIATSSTLGGVKPLKTRTSSMTFSGSQSSTSSTGTVNDFTTTSGRYYAVEADVNGRLFVNVPWTDNNTVYSPGTGISFSGTTINHSNSITAATAGSTTTTTASGTYGTLTVVGGIKYDAQGHITNVYTRTITLQDNNTTYGNATTSNAGLMSATDKSNLDTLSTSPYIIYTCHVNVSSSGTITKSNEKKASEISSVSYSVNSENGNYYLEVKTSPTTIKINPMVTGESNGSAFITSNSGYGTFRIFIMNTSNINNMIGSGCFISFVKA